MRSLNCSQLDIQPTYKRVQVDVVPFALGFDDDDDIGSSSKVRFRRKFYVILYHSHCRSQLKIQFYDDKHFSFVRYFLPQYEADVMIAFCNWGKGCNWCKGWWQTVRRPPWHNGATGCQWLSLSPKRGRQFSSSPRMTDFMCWVHSDRLYSTHLHFTACVFVKQ